MEQRILFQSYSPPNISSYTPLKISINFLLPAKSSYSLHPIKLKLLVVMIAICMPNDGVSPIQVITKDADMAKKTLIGKSSKMARNSERLSSE